MSTTHSCPPLTKYLGVFMVIHNGVGIYLHITDHSGDFAYSYSLTYTEIIPNQFCSVLWKRGNGQWEPGIKVLAPVHGFIFDSLKAKSILTPADQEFWDKYYNTVHSLTQEEHDIILTMVNIIK